MQLYKVEFRTQRGDAVETGTYLACARNTEDAEALIAATINAPPSMTEFTTRRVKPSIYELSRRDFKLSEIADFLVSKGPEQEGAVHEINASAKVFGYSESSVIRRFAGALVESASATNRMPNKNVNELSLTIERADHRPRQSRVEEQSIYKEKRFFAGGAARPR